MAAIALFAGLATVAFYIAFTTVLQVAFYRRRSAETRTWKVQPEETSWQKAAGQWWLPLLDVVGGGAAKPGRHPLHGLYATVNLLIAGAFMVVAVELTARGWSGVLFDWDEAGGWTGMAAGAALAVVYENVAEYVWHRAMHTRFLYTRLHKLHHYYKAPTPFDDMFVHPLEVTGYYMILYGPVVLFRLHWASLLVYAAIMGTAGMLDHSGVRLNILGVYTTEDHDIHHELYSYNYGFPFPFVDQLVGTYRASARVPHAA